MTRPGPGPCGWPRGARAWCIALAAACAAWGAGAQSAPPANEVLARDLREEVLRIPVTVKDMHGRRETRTMPITVFRPDGAGPYPLVVYNHGRATADRRAAQGRSRVEYLARYLVAKGFVVLAPTRIGYWETHGDFDPEASGSCSALRPEPMSVAASDQVLAAVELARTLPYVDASRWIVAGQSVGGLTSVATVGRNPAGLLAGINFSGGAGGDPVRIPQQPCSPQQLARYWGTLGSTAAAPMLWLYWQNDKYWGPDIPRRWHQAWTQGGGRAEFFAFGPSGEDGHNGLAADMDHWLPVVDGFLARLGFTAPAILQRPPASAYAEVTDQARVPVLGAQGKAQGYARFLALDAPRAFAIGERGAWGFAAGDYAIGKAVGNCQRSGQVCRLYAVDNDVVWQSN